MKKYIYFAATALALAACSNEDDLSVDDGPVPIRLSSGIEVQTRAATDIQGSAFDGQDSVKVFIREAVNEGEDVSTEYDPLTYTTGANGALTLKEGQEQPYFPTSGKGVYIHAVYPSNAPTTFSVQADQSTDKNYKASDLMYGKAEDGAVVERTKEAVPVTFEHLLAKVTVKLEVGKGMTAEKLAGAKVELLGVMPEVSFTAATGTIGEATGTEIAVTVFDKTSTTQEGSAIVPPQELDIDFLRITLNDGGEMTGRLDSDRQPILQKGNEYVYTITVNLSSVDLTASIKKWSSQAVSSGNATLQ